MKKIYIVLTHTGTYLSRFIRFYTKATYSHVSLGLDRNLNELYSFGRKYPYIAIIGRFVREYIDQRYI